MGIPAVSQVNTADQSQFAQLATKLSYHNVAVSDVRVVEKDAVAFMIKIFPD